MTADLPRIPKRVGKHQVLERTLLFASERIYRQETAVRPLLAKGHTVITPHHIVESIDRIAQHSHAVLIEGETGTGKEVTAAAIHRRSWAHRQVCQTGKRLFWR